MSRHTTDFDPVKCIGYGPNDIVVFNHPEHGRDSDKEFVQKHLLVGNRYRVAWVDCGSWHTNVWLEGFPDTIFFNSVHFEKWDESKPTYEQLESELARLREAIEKAPHEETCATNKYDNETLENAGYPTIKCTCWKRELDKEGKA